MVADVRIGNFNTGVQPRGLHQGRVRLCEPGEHRAVRNPHTRVPRAEPVDGVEGGRPPAAHDDVVCLVVVRPAGKGDPGGLAWQAAPCKRRSSFADQGPRARYVVYSRCRLKRSFFLHKAPSSSTCHSPAPPLLSLVTDILPHSHVTPHIALCVHDILSYDPCFPVNVLPPCFVVVFVQCAARPVSCPPPIHEPLHPRNSITLIKLLLCNT